MGKNFPILRFVKDFLWIPEKILEGGITENGLVHF